MVPETLVLYSFDDGQRACCIEIQYEITIMIYSYKDHPARIPISDNNLAYPHLSDGAQK